MGPKVRQSYENAVSHLGPAEPESPEIYNKFFLGMEVGLSQFELGICSLQPKTLY